MSTATRTGQPVMHAADVSQLLFTLAEHIEEGRLDPTAAAAAVRRAAVHVVNEGDRAIRPTEVYDFEADRAAHPFVADVTGTRWKVYRDGVMEARGTALTPWGAARRARTEAARMDAHVRRYGRL